ncbi:hypothetical protein, partial [Bacillus paralicheniformis]|uniref:hypothetical protein n=1 Tax=Bacillus paralicheniformis TaxID=1648923 RepID=UPI001C9A9F6B
YSIPSAVLQLLFLRFCLPYHVLLCFFHTTFSLPGNVIRHADESEGNHDSGCFMLCVPSRTHLA